MATKSLNTPARPEALSNTPQETPNRTPSPSLPQYFHTTYPAFTHICAQANGDKAKAAEIISSVNDLSAFANECLVLYNGHVDAETRLEAIQQQLDASTRQHEALSHEMRLSLDEKDRQAQELLFQDREIKSLTSLLKKHEQSGSFSSGRSPEFKMDEIFAGEPSELKGWKQKIMLKLVNNADWWHTEQERMGLVIARLSGKAHKQVAYGLQDSGIISFANVNAILEVLTLAFGDLNDQQNSGKKVMGMKQGNSPMNVFLPEWHSHANSTGWGDTALIDHLRQAVHNDIAYRLSFTRDEDVPQTLTEYIKLVQRADHDVRKANPDYFRSRPATMQSHMNQPPQISPLPLTTSNGGSAMDLNAMKWTMADVDTSRKPRTDSERLARKEFCTLNNLCHWCASPKHRSSDCATAPWAKKG